MSGSQKSPREAIAAAFGLIYGKSAKDLKAEARADVKSMEDVQYPESLRVSATKVEKSEFPHSWRRSDSKSKSKASVARWVCTKCGGWVDFSSGTRPNGHAVPTCSQMSVRAVHDS